MNLDCGLKVTEESGCQNLSFINICLKWQGRGVEDKITFSSEYESATCRNKEVIIVLLWVPTEDKKNSIKLKQQVHLQERPRRVQNTAPLSSIRKCLRAQWPWLRQARWNERHGMLYQPQIVKEPTSCCPLSLLKLTERYTLCPTQEFKNTVLDSTAHVISQPKC